MLSQQPAKRGWLPLFGARNSACCLFFAEIVEYGPSAKWVGAICSRGVALVYGEHGLQPNGLSIMFFG